jgi:hypothetical protein
MEARGVLVPALIGLRLCSEFVRGKMVVAIGVRVAAKPVPDENCGYGPVCTSPACPGKPAMLIYRVMSSERSPSTDQKLFLCDLCVSANFAINLPETVSTSAAG